MSKSEVRDKLVQNLEKKLIGPETGPDEVIKVFPSNKYIVGVLYPRGTEVGPEQDVNNSEEEESEEDMVLNKSSSIKDALRPSSFGMSFMVDDNTTEIPIEVRWATYSKLGGEDEGFKRKEWHVERTISLSAPGMEKGLPYPLYVTGDLEHKCFELFCRKYEKSSGRYYVSIFMVNKEKGAEKKEGKLDESCIFSPSMCVHFDGRSIIAKEEVASQNMDDDLRSLSLLYHDRHEFGTGHGCSVEWEDELVDRCSTIRTTFLPKYHWQPLYFKDIEYDFFMKDMSDHDKEEVTIEKLSNFLVRYKDWISETFSEKEKDGLQRSMHETFEQHKVECETSLDRMYEGLALLKDGEVFNAFCFMNESMYLQRVYSQAAREHRENKDEGFKDPDIHDRAMVERHKWRPFQIAFILQSIPSIVDPNDKYREVADLLWIPTGGGKTEAYLGLAAFTMGLRRLKAKGRPMEYLGVNVFMRYTLRLLTIQQFQRATSLICACEVIRHKNKFKWGAQPFAVGLFVGLSTTSNQIGTRKDYENYQNNHARNHLKTTAHYAMDFWRKRDTKPDTSNPFQLSNCPWCGEDLDVTCFTIDESSDHLLTHCKRTECPFNRIEIPAFTVDDNIYSRLPSMIIGTVDKFAMLPFNPRIGMLFGHVDKYCPSHGFICKTDKDHSNNHRNGVLVQKMSRPLHPPNLIIQDELHLINGPLGSMVGLYETTIDRLSCRPGEQTHLRPKLIASTATIRKAAEQVKCLFLRDLKRFPSPGTDYKDSFFVKETEDSSNAKLFVGVFPSGIGQKTVMKRTMSSFLVDVKEMKDSKVPLHDWDDYWTIISYFNSIRDLGSAKTTIEDDVFNDVKRSDRDILPVEELTSRISSKELPCVLDKLNIRGVDDRSISVLTCSNMFSVGVDVQRLGLMIMNNQPKSTSEYIQSVGRVGRNNTGLVIVLYNWARPRDQSHYERFYDYHNRIQSHVEAMTVTPFSEGARERGLHAQYVSMARILSSGLSDNSEAGHFDAVFRSKPESREYIEWIVKRIEGISPEEKEEALKELNKFMDEWEELAGDSRQNDERLLYQKFPMMSTEDPILLKVIDDKIDSQGAYLPMLTPTSMRNVEKEIIIYKIYGLPTKV